MEKVKKVLLVVFVMMFFIGIILVTDFGKMQKYKNNEVTDLANLGYRQMQTGDLVTGKVDYVLDTVAEEYETKFGIRTSDDSTKLYYIISLPNSYAVYETSNKEEYDLTHQVRRLPAFRLHRHRSGCCGSSGIDCSAGTEDQGKETVQPGILLIYKEQAQCLFFFVGSMPGAAICRI